MRSLSQNFYAFEKQLYIPLFSDPTNLRKQEILFDLSHFSTTKKWFVIGPFFQYLRNEDWMPRQANKMTFISKIVYMFYFNKLIRFRFILQCGKSKLRYEYNK